MGCYKKGNSSSCCPSYPLPTTLAAASPPFPSFPSPLCLFNLFGEDLFHLPSKHVPIFLSTSRGGGADTDPVQNEIVDVWLPWGAGPGGSGMFLY